MTHNHCNYRPSNDLENGPTSQKFVRTGKNQSDIIIVQSLKSVCLNGATCNNVRSVTLNTTKIIERGGING